MTAKAKKIDPAQEVSNVLEDIRPIIQDRLEPWKKLQNGLRSKFDDFQNDPSIAHAIYRVYCREDRQGPLGVENPHIKNEYKIAEEICLNRSGGHKERLGGKIKVAKRPNFSIDDVDDVLGVTIVTPFDSDILTVAKRINREIGKDTLREFKPPKNHKKKEYEGLHLYLTLPDPEFEGLFCEVQVKTSVQDAFSWKTHSLAYKPNPRTPEWFPGQFTRVVQVLRVADSISDQLKLEIENDKFVNWEKRKAARQGLIEDGRKATVSGLTEGAKDDEESELKECQQIVDLMGPAFDSDDELTYSGFRRIKDAVDAMLAKHRVSQNSFRIACLTAILDPSGIYQRRLEDIFLRRIDGLRQTETENSKGFLEGFIKAALTLSITYYCLDDCEKGIRACRKITAKYPKKKHLGLARAHSNIAYYSAELFRRSGSARHRSDAVSALKTAKELFDGKFSIKDQDTFGYVQIETGETIEDVEEGLKMCREAKDAAVSSEAASEELKSLAELFFNIHREAAYRRLASLSAL